MAAGGETKNADTFRVNLPRSGVSTSEANGTLGVEQWHLMSQLWQSILQDNCRNAVLVEPLRDRIALTISNVPDVAAAGTKLPSP